MGREVGVALLVAVVLFDVVQVVAAHGDGALHLGGQHDAAQDAAADADVRRERALLVHVRPLDRLARRLEAQPDALVVAQLVLARCLAQQALAPREDRLLLLVCAFVLCPVGGSVSQSVSQSQSVGECVSVCLSLFRGRVVCFCVAYLFDLRGHCVRG